MMHYETTSKKIDNCIEVRKNLWTAIIVLSGGLGGLILTISTFNLNIDSLLKLILLVLGISVNYFLFKNLSDCNKEIMVLFKKLDKGE